MKLEMPDSNMSENSKYSLLLLGSVLLLVFVGLYIIQPLREDIQKNEQELTQAQTNTLTLQITRPPSSRRMQAIALSRIQRKRSGMARQILRQR